MTPLAMLTVVGIGIVGVDDDALKASLLKFASKLSEARRILRLFDDLPMHSYTLHYGFGDKEKVWRCFVQHTCKV